MLSQDALRRLITEGAYQLLSAYSPTFEEARAIEVLHRFVKDRLGYREVFTDSVGNLIACYGEGGTRVGLIGHIDTVPGHLPVLLRGDTISGRGAVDAKGPLIAATVGASIASEDVWNDLRVCVAALVGEEGPSHGAWELVRRGERFDHVVILEPTGGDGVVIEYRGSASITLRCAAPGGHTSSPGVGGSACEKLFNTVSVLRASLGEGFTVAVTRVLCGEGGGVLPRSGVMEVNVRIPWGRGFADLDRAVSGSLLDGCTYTISGFTPPARGRINSPLVRALFRSLIRLGVRPSLSRKAGTSDMNVLLGRVSEDVVAFGPGDPALSHTDAEVVSISDLVRAAHAYAGALRELAVLRKSGRVSR